MTLAAVDWHCPRCHAGVVAAPGAWSCAPCGVSYPVIAGIPDFRIDLPAWVDLAEDRRRAEWLAAHFEDRPVFDLIEQVFGTRRGWTYDHLSRRRTEILEAPRRLRGQLGEWLEAPTSRGVFLDLGCGPGQLLAAAAQEGRAGIGIDVMLEWLVVARALVAEHGGTAVLAAAMGEALPLATASVQGVVSLDVIEHVGDPRRYLREIDRVVVTGGVVALATPNRFSLAAEPHVGVWGVGWVPRRWQARYVGWRSGKSYAYCRLLSLRELLRLLRTQTRLRPAVLIPPIPEEHLRRFAARKARFARAYNALRSIPPLRAAFRLVGPFFRVLARKE